MLSAWNNVWHIISAQQILYGILIIIQAVDNNLFVVNMRNPTSTGVSKKISNKNKINKAEIYSFG